NIIDSNTSNKYAYAQVFPDDEENSFDYVFDPSEYIDDVFDTEIEKFEDGNLDSQMTEEKEKIEATDGDEIIEKGGKRNTISSSIDNSDLAMKQSNNLDFNFVAVGDWDCTSDTKDTVKNVLKQDPEIVLALGDLSYNGKAKCWLKLIQPFADKTKIVFGNHEVESSKIIKDYINYFDLERQYYSFTYKNIHFIALSTEVPYEEGSTQYKAIKRDLQKYSNDPSINWIVAFYHRQAYSSGGGPDNEDEFRETYHPLFDKYNVDLALQGHLHAYERLHPIIFNHDRDSKPFVTDNSTNYYKNPEGTIFITAGTGGAHDMDLSSPKYYSANGIDGEFGILNISVENNGNVLKGSFIGNDKNEIFDEFEIIKNQRQE
ncbi:MAG: metallophosphoesterase, partial [Nitrososphaeraceae archaeon]|nr:metallophosphoesterase [Nitrososphaeraceae archaeon]